MKWFFLLLGQHDLGALHRPDLRGLVLQPSLPWCLGTRRHPHPKTCALDYISWSLASTGTNVSAKWNFQQGWVFQWVLIHFEALSAAAFSWCLWLQSRFIWNKYARLISGLCSHEVPPLLTAVSRADAVHGVSQDSSCLSMWRKHCTRAAGTWGLHPNPTNELLVPLPALVRSSCQTAFVGSRKLVIWRSVSPRLKTTA